MYIKGNANIYQVYIRAVDDVKSDEIHASRSCISYIDV